MFKFLIIQGISIYQKIFSFMREVFGLSKTFCRFHPSCSEHFKQALKKYGLFKGGWKGVKRILRCGPWSQGGVDLP